MPADPEGAKKDLDTTNTQGAVRLQGLSPQGCITGFEPAQFNAYKPLPDGGSTGVPLLFLPGSCMQCGHTMLS
ncbi:hypothetical protein DSO57_1008217 [Entomophthora muscae]|uniref:Uncharacterized protein n=1 Tax=Entomophthora muscae TaxID=34485 RepID=A0ACC2SWG4_9FUNG|nr:hypothetical protein DSO57_1008217 [Entomophthora muscae]